MMMFWSLYTKIVDILKYNNKHCCEFKRWKFIILFMMDSYFCVKIQNFILEEWISLAFQLLSWLTDKLWFRRVHHENSEASNLSELNESHQLSNNLFIWQLKHNHSVEKIYLLFLFGTEYNRNHKTITDFIKTIHQEKIHFITIEIESTCWKKDSSFIWIGTNFSLMNERKWSTVCSCLWLWIKLFPWNSSHCQKKIGFLPNFPGNHWTSTESLPFSFEENIWNNHLR